MTRSTYAYVAPAESVLQNPVSLERTRNELSPPVSYEGGRTDRSVSKSAGILRFNDLIVLVALLG